LSVLLFYDFWLPLLVSDHCIVCPSALWLLITPLGIWSLYCLSFCFMTFDYPSWYLIIVLSVLLLCDFWLPLMVSDHCIVCPSALRLLITPSWYLIIVLSVLLLYDFWLPLFVSDHCMVCPSALRLLITPLGIWSLYCLSCFTTFDYPSWYLIIVLSVLLYDFWLPLLVSDHCIVCPSVLRLLITPLGIWSLYCLSFCFTTFDYPSWYLIIVLSVLLLYDFWLHLLVSDHCIVCPSALRLLITPLGIWSLYCLSFCFMTFDYPSWYLIIVLSVLLLCDFWLPLLVSHHCIVCPSALRLLITPLGIWSLYGLSFCFTTFDYPSWYLIIVLSVLLLYDFWLPLLVSDHCIVCPALRLLITPLGIWSLYCLSCFTTFDYPSWYLIIVLSVLLLYDFWLPLLVYDHCIFCPSALRLLISPLGIWSLYCMSCFTTFDYPSWYLIIVLSVLLLYDFWLPLLVSDHCIVCHALRLLITPLGIWSLYCLSCFTTFDYPSWYLIIVLSVLLYDFW
jgi:hypothetical protein